jgi:hypothetical protein
MVADCVLAFIKQIRVLVLICNTAMDTYGFGSSPNRVNLRWFLNRAYSDYSVGKRMGSDKGGA